MFLRAKLRSIHHLCMMKLLDAVVQLGLEIPES